MERYSLVILEESFLKRPVKQKAETSQKFLPVLFFSCQNLLYQVLPTQNQPCADPSST